MKKTIRAIISILAVGAMLLSLAACGGKKDDTDNSLMQGIYDKLVAADSGYSQWKADFNTTTFEEKLDGEKITISAKGEEGLDGEYVFTHDGDYITYTPKNNEDYAGYSVFLYIRNAVADYYGMNNVLMNGYSAGLSNLGIEDKYFIIDFNNLIFKVYVAEKWDMKELDEMFIDEKALEYTTPFTEDYVSKYVNCGKITVAAFGTADKFDMIVGEYGENTELTYKSIMNTMEKLQPKDLTLFQKYYTELKEVKDADGYNVSFGIPQEVQQEHEYQAAEGFSYVTISFTAA